MDSLKVYSKGDTFYGFFFTTAGLDVNKYSYVTYEMVAGVGNFVGRRVTRGITHLDSLPSERRGATTAECKEKFLRNHFFQLDLPYLVLHELQYH